VSEKKKPQQKEKWKAIVGKKKTRRKAPFILSGEDSLAGSRVQGKAGTSENRQEEPGGENLDRIKQPSAVR